MEILIYVLIGLAGLFVFAFLVLLSLLFLAYLITMGYFTYKNYKYLDYLFNEIKNDEIAKFEEHKSYIVPNDTDEDTSDDFWKG